MKVFQEKQFINRWWLFMLILAVIVIVVGTAFYATRNASEETAVIVSLISIAIALPIVIALLKLRLETRIDEKGILAYFRPFKFTVKYYPWDQIKECYVRRLNPVEEYGGWGLRGIGQNWKAYLIKENTGIQIITKDEENFLVGTQKPTQAEKVLRNYQQAYPTDEI